MDGLQRSLGRRGGDAGHAVTLHEDDAMVAQRLSQLIAQLSRSDEHRVRPQRHRPFDQLALHVQHWQDRRFADAHHRGHRLMRVHHRLDVRSRSIDSGVDEALARWRMRAVQVDTIEIYQRHIRRLNLVLGADLLRMSWFDQHVVCAWHPHAGVAHVVDQVQSEQHAADIRQLLSKLELVRHAPHSIERGLASTLSVLTTFAGTFATSTQLVAA
jgi:hypothetical protein